MLFWMMGSLSDATPGKAAALLPYGAAAGAVVLFSASRLNLFAVGEENAADRDRGLPPGKRGCYRLTEDTMTMRASGCWATRSECS